MVPPILVYDKVLFIRNVCKVPGDMLSSFLTSLDFSHCFGCSVLDWKISFRSFKSKMRKSFRSCFVIISTAITNNFDGYILPINTQNNLSKLVFFTFFFKTKIKRSPAMLDFSLLNKEKKPQFL